MTATSSVPATIDALVAALTAAGVTAWDGPVITGDFENAVYVGYDGDPDGEFLAVEMDQEWAGIGNKARSETFDIICCAYVLSGPPETKACRDTAYGLMATVETVLRADPSIAQAPYFVAAIKPKSFFPWPTSDGMQGRLVFHIHVQTRI
jgi:hypothetical protein